MARSRKPTVWIEKRRSSTGYTTYRVRAEKDGVRLPDIVCGPNKAHAAEIRDRVRAELWAGKLNIFAKPAPLALGKFVENILEYGSAHKAAATVLNFDTPALNALMAHLGKDCEVSSIERDDLEEWKLAQLASGLAPHTVAMRLRSVKSAFSHAVRLKLMNVNPAAGVLSPKTEPSGRILLSSEIAGMLDHVSGLVGRGLWFGLHTGLRLSELIESDWSKVDRTMEPWTLVVVGKGSRKRVVHLHASARAVLGSPRESGPLFAGLTRHMIHSHMAAATRTLKLGRVRFHDLRHTWATEYMRRTGDLPGLMLEGGWSTLEAVKVYQHLSRGRSAAGAAVDYGVSPPILPPTAENSGNGDVGKT